MRRQEPFLKRWARRKSSARTTGARASAQADAGSGCPDEAPLPRAAGPDETEAVSAHSRAIPENRVPSLASVSLLHPESNFTVFMAPGVPPDVRRAALRRLWRLCPDLARPDSLVEYGEDYTDAAKAAGIVRTSYRVAKGAVRGDDEAAPTTAADEAPREFEDAEHADRSGATDGPASASADDERKDEH